MLPLIFAIAAAADLNLRVEKAVQVSFRTSAGKVYQVESSADVEPPDWRPEGKVIIGNRQRQSLAFVTEATEKRIYRVQELFLADGLLAFYPFQGNANDQSGNGNDGVVHEAVLTTDRFNRPNEAYSFDGVNDHIILSGEAPFTSEDYSISLWFKAEALPSQTEVAKNHATLISRGLGNMEIKVGVSGPSDPAGLRFYPRPIDPETGQLVDAISADVKVGLWMHLVAIYEGQSGAARLILNGKELPLHHKNGPLWQDDTQPARLGTRYDGAMAFKGKLDSVRIYNRVLSANEIKALAEIDY